MKTTKFLLIVSAVLSIMLFTACDLPKSNKNKASKEKTVSVIDSIIAAANIKDYEKPKQGVVFVEEEAKLNLRPCPEASDNCPPIEKLEAGTAITILGESEGELNEYYLHWYRNSGDMFKREGEWFKVRYKNITAFASSKFVADKEEWDEGFRRSLIGIFQWANTPEGVPETVIEINGEHELYFFSDKSNFYDDELRNVEKGKIVKLLFGKYGEVEKFVFLRATDSIISKMNSIDHTERKEGLKRREEREEKRLREIDLESKRRIERIRNTPISDLRW